MAASALVSATQPCSRLVSCARLTDFHVCPGCHRRAAPWAVLCLWGPHAKALAAAFTEDQVRRVKMAAWRTVPGARVRPRRARPTGRSPQGSAGRHLAERAPPG